MKIMRISGAPAEFFAVRAPVRVGDANGAPGSPPDTTIAARHFSNRSLRAYARLGAVPDCMPKHRLQDRMRRMSFLDRGARRSPAPTRVPKALKVLPLPAERSHGARSECTGGGSTRLRRQLR